MLFQVELPKFVGKAAEGLNPAELWGKFLEEPRSSGLTRELPQAQALNAARDRMEAFMSLTPDVVREIQLSMYDHDIATLKKMAELEGRAKGKAEGHAEGLEEGLAVKSLAVDEMVRRLKAEGLSQESIRRLVEGL